MEKLAVLEGIKAYEMNDILLDNGLDNGQVNVKNTLSSVGDIDIKTAGGTIGKAKDAETFMEIAKANNVSCIYYMIEVVDRYPAGGIKALKKTYAAIGKDQILIVLREDWYCVPDDDTWIKNYNSSSAVIGYSILNN